MSETCTNCGAILNTSREFVHRHGAKCAECNTVWAVPVAHDLEAGEAGLFDYTRFEVVRLTAAAGIVYATERLTAGDWVRLQPDRRVTKVELDP
jgi:hypothetical protein